MTEGRSAWQEDRRYLDRAGTHLIVVSKRTDGEKTFWKTERRKLSRADRLYYQELGPARRLASG